MTETAKQASKPRGIRNNNPLNIEFNGTRWLGIDFAASEQEGRFCVFISPEHGIRAAAVLLNNYQKLYGISTIAAMIDRFAPDHENPTSAYAQFVARACNVETHTTITIRDYLPAILPAMIRFENGQQPYTPEQISLGIQMAGLWNE